MTELETHARVIATLIRAHTVQARLATMTLEACIAIGLPRDAAAMLLKDAAAGFENCPDPQTGEEFAKTYRLMATQVANG